jgi:biopolymer transport protein ExbD
LASWDVFHADRLELERGLDAAAIRDALARGDLRDDDLVRPAGTTVTWARLSDLPELAEAAEPRPSLPPPAPEGALTGSRESTPGAIGTGDFEVHADDRATISANPPPPTLRTGDWRDLRAELDDVAFPVIKDQAEAKPPADRPPARGSPPTPQWQWADDGDDEDDDDGEDLDQADDLDEPAARSAGMLDDLPDVDLGEVGPLSDRRGEDSRTSKLALPVVVSRGWDDVSPDVEDDGDDIVSLSRSGPATVEELDLAPMVDVAFQLVLFFMVTATTVLYKTLEIPKPANEQAPAAVAQGRSLADLENDYILVDINAAGLVQIDRQPVAANMSAIVERLRKSRETTHRKAMLLSAEFATPHRSCVLAYDAANEIGLGIVIARPSTPQGPAPSLLAQPPQSRAAAPAAGPPN